MLMFIFSALGIISISGMCTALYATYDEMFRVIAVAGAGLLIAAVGLYYSFNTNTANHAVATTTTLSHIPIT